jgi:hypothetical protein
MEIHTHICTRCKAEYNGGNITLIPDGWQWHGGKLICGDCNTAASFMAHSSASGKTQHLPVNPPVTEPRTAKRDGWPLWQIVCQFRDNHRIARSRTLTVSARNPLDAIEKVKTTIALHADDLVSMEITPPPMTIADEQKPKERIAA